MLTEDSPNIGDSSSYKMKTDLRNKIKNEPIEAIDLTLSKVEMVQIEENPLLEPKLELFDKEYIQQPIDYSEVHLVDRGNSKTTNCERHLKIQSIIIIQIQFYTMDIIYK